MVEGVLRKLELGTSRDTVPFFYQIQQGRDVFYYSELGPQSVDIVSMVFVLSAIHPHKHDQV